MLFFTLFFCVFVDVISIHQTGQYIGIDREVGIEEVTESLLFFRDSINKKGILSLICGVCFRLNFDWDVIRL